VRWLLEFPAMRILALLMLIVSVQAVSAADPLIIGKWKYDPDKSSVKLPAQHVYWIQEPAGKVKYGFNLDLPGGGKKAGAEAVIQFDGKDYPQSLNPSFDMIAMKQIDDHNWNSSSKLHGKEGSHGIWTVSLDGKMMIHVNEGTHSKTGKAFRSVTVWERQ